MDNVADIAEISRILQRFLDNMSTGFGLLSSRAALTRLLEALIVINISISSLHWLLSNQPYVVELVKKVLFISFIVWIIDNWGTITLEILGMFESLGLSVAGSDVNASVIRNPGLIAVQGFEIAITYTEALDDLAGIRSFFSNFPLILVTGLALLAVLIAYGAITLQLFFALVMFYLGATLAFITLPFATLPQTKWLSERPIGWVFTSALKFASVIVVLGLASSLLDDLQPSSASEITIARAMTTILISVLLLILALLAPKLAADLLSGAPSLGFADVANTAGGVGSAVSGGTKAVGHAALGGAGLAAQAAQAASKLARGAAGGSGGGGGGASRAAGGGLSAPKAAGRSISFGSPSQSLKASAGGVAQLGQAAKSISSATAGRGIANSPSF